MASIYQTGVVWDSITKNGKHELFELQVARNQISNHSVLNIFGYQTSVTTASIPVWENASTYTYPTSALTMTYASTQSETLTMTVTGLDANYAIVTDTVTFSAGTSGTATNGTQFFRINSMIVTSTATLGGTNVGQITAKNGGTTYAQINAGVGKTQMAIYTVPAGYSFFLNRIDVFASNPYTSANNLTFINWQQNPTTNVAFAVAQSPFISILDIHRQYPLAYTEKTDIQFRVNTSTGTYAVGAFGEGVLIANATSTL
jgi:hypothetical protein